MQAATGEPLAQISTAPRPAPPWQCGNSSAAQAASPAPTLPHASPLGWQAEVVCFIKKTETAPKPRLALAELVAVPVLWV